ncbi:hypothetical protein ACHAWC_000405 [Mediolabrus comicus]
MYRPVVSILLIFLASTALYCCSGFSSTRRTTTAGRGTTHLILPSTGTANHYFLPSKEIITHTSTISPLSPTKIGKPDSKDIISLCAKKSNSSEKDRDTEKKKISPATLVLAPLVFLFGLDLVLNLAVVTKRSLEVFFTGEYTVYTPWQ